jgi:hypothetical protein
MYSLRKLALAGTALIALVGAGTTGATMLDAHISVDNAFTYYLSTNDSVAGVLIGSGDSWPTTYDFSNALTPGVINYIHIVATDLGAPASLVGSFGLSDGDFKFANGTSVQLTNTTDWKVSLTGFGVENLMPLSLGPNSVSPWGTRARISTDALNIWSPENCGSCTRYFSATITPTAGVPEPEQFALLAVGLLALGFKLRRRR